MAHLFTVAILASAACTALAAPPIPPMLSATYSFFANVTTRSPSAESHAEYNWYFDANLPQGSSSLQQNVYPDLVQQLQIGAGAGCTSVEYVTNPNQCKINCQGGETCTGGVSCACHNNNVFALVPYTQYESDCYFFTGHQFLVTVNTTDGYVEVRFCIIDATPVQLREDFYNTAGASASAVLPSLAPATRAALGAPLRSATFAGQLLMEITDYDPSTPPAMTFGEPSFCSC